MYKLKFEQENANGKYQVFTKEFKTENEKYEFVKNLRASAFRLGKHFVVLEDD